MHTEEISGPARLRIDLPSDFKVEESTKESITATSNGVRLFLFRWPGKEFRGTRSSLSQLGRLGKTQFGDTVVPETEVRLGVCEGYRYLVKSKDTGGTLEAKYLLRVPGGYVTATIGGDYGNLLGTFDEAVFERLLATARIEKP